MTTKPKIPQHFLLGITPDVPEVARRKVLTALICSTLLISLLVTQEIKVFKTQYQTTIDKIKNKNRLRRNTGAFKLEFL